MSRGSKHGPEPTGRKTKDVQIVQALTETRRIAAERTDAPGWAELHERTGRILDGIGSVESGQPYEATFAGMDRMDRRVIQIDPEAGDRLAAALMAVSDRPEEPQVERANEVLRSLEDELR